MRARRSTSPQRASREKHQFVRGEVFAMAGRASGTMRLSRGSSATLGMPDGTRCQVFPGLEGLRGRAGDLHYPDVTVACGRLALYEGAQGDVLTNPKVIVEVLSEGTERYDRGEKAEGYRATPSPCRITSSSANTRRTSSTSRGERTARGRSARPRRAGAACSCRCRRRSTWTRSTPACSTCQRSTTRPHPAVRASSPRGPGLLSPCPCCCVRR